MKRQVLIFIPLLLIAISSFSQNTYPSKLILNRDTVIAITPIQVIKINEKLSQLDTLRMYASDLENYLSIEQQLTERQININRILSAKNIELLSQVDNFTKLNTTNENIIKYLNKEIEIQKRKKRTSFFGGTLVGISATSVLILIFK